ncbi:hypothetical protein SUDANB140_04255 [Streptomyces sp. enrichment culture]
MYGGGLDMLSREARDQLDRLEEGITPEEREEAFVDLRVLVNACSRFPDLLEEANVAIFAEPYAPDGHYLSVLAPQPGAEGADSRDVEIGRWVPGDPDEDYEDCGSATGSAVVRCVLGTSPGVDEIADLLNRVEGQPDVLAKWAEVSVGGVFEGTRFVVTECYDD